MRVVLPWPPAQLSPNSRCHWRTKAKAAKAYKEWCWKLAKEAHMAAPASGPIHVSLEFVPSVKRRRDLDNLIANMKHGLDGLALAMGVDDSRFHLSARLSEQPGGFVRVFVS